MCNFNPINKATSNLSPCIQLINNDIPISNCAKFLGVIVDKNLTWHDNIHYISGKISKGVGILGKLKYMQVYHCAKVRKLYVFCGPREGFDRATRKVLK